MGWVGCYGLPPQLALVILQVWPQILLSAIWIYKRCTAPAGVTVGRGAVTMKVMLIPRVTSSAEES